MKKPRATLKPALTLDPRARRHFEQITRAVPITGGDVLAATLASMVFAAFAEEPTFERLAECREWLAELRMTPRTRAASRAS